MVDHDLNFMNIFHNLDTDIMKDNLITMYRSYRNKGKNPYESYLMVIEDLYSIGLISIDETRKLMSYGDTLMKYLS